MSAAITTISRRPFMGPVAFVRAASGMSCGGCPGVIAIERAPLLAKQDGDRLAHEDPLHPGAGGVEA